MQQPLSKYSASSDRSYRNREDSFEIPYPRQTIAEITGHAIESDDRENSSRLRIERNRRIKSGEEKNGI